MNKQEFIKWIESLPDNATLLDFNPDSIIVEGDKWPWCHSHMVYRQYADVTMNLKVRFTGTKEMVGKMELGVGDWESVRWVEEINENTI